MYATAASPIEAHKFIYYEMTEEPASGYMIFVVLLFVRNPLLFLFMLYISPMILLLYVCHNMLFNVRR